jgi:hypothetical protein
LTARLEKTILIEKMIRENLSRVEESVTESTYRLGIVFERYEKKYKNSATKFVPSTIHHKEEKALKPAKPHYPSNSKTSFNLKRCVKRESPSQEMKLLYVCFVAILITWMSFTSGVRELRGGVLSMLETHIVMSSLISRLVLILMFRLIFTLVLLLALLHVLFLSSLMDLTIAHMVLVHEITTLSLDTLVMAHVLIMVIVSRVGLIFLLESHTPTLSRDTWMVYIFSVVVHVPLRQVVRCKGL